MLIYIASPYYSPDSGITQRRMEKIYEIMGEYIKRGEHVISPLSMHEVVIRHNLDGTYAYWGKYCLNILNRCDKMVVLCMDGWKESKGLADEIRFCTENNIPIEYLENIDMSPRKEPLPGYGDLMTLLEFVDTAKCGCITEDDGGGHFATIDHMYPDTNCFDPKTKPKYATHVIWFNK